MVANLSSLHNNSAAFDLSRPCAEVGMSNYCAIHKNLLVCIKPVQNVCNVLEH